MARIVILCSILLGVFAYALPAVAANDPLAQPLAQLATYDFGKSRAPLMKIEALSRQAELRPRIEDGMIGVIQNPKATVAGKQFACRMLRLVGSEKSVPVLAGLLADAQLSSMARWAMTLMPYPAVDAAFLGALDTVKGDLRTGVIGSIGERNDPAAAPKLAALAADRDTTTALAAIAALGRVDNAAAAKALAGVKVSSPALQSALADARLQVAERMLATGKVADADGIYKSLFAAGNPEMVRVAALGGLARTGKEKALGLLFVTMKGSDARMAEAACKAINTIPGAEMGRVVAEALPQFAPRMQAMVITALMERGDRGAADGIAKLLTSPDAEVRLAAAKALAGLGGAGQVSALAQASLAGDAAGASALESLGLLHGEGVAPALRKLAEAPDAKLRVRGIEIAELRHDTEAVPALIKAMGDPDQKIRIASIKALGTVGGEKEFPVMIERLLAAKGAERGALEKSLVSIAGRVTGKDPAAAGIVAKMDGANNAAKGSLMVVLAGLNCDASYAAISGQVAATDTELKKVALRALGTWPTIKPAGLLLARAKAETDPVCRVLALRGCVDVVSRDQDSSPTVKLKMFKAAWKLAKQPDDKTMILKGVGGVPDAAALAMVEPLLSDKDAGSAAEFTYLKIANSLENRAAKTAALRKIMQTAKTPAVRQQAAGTLKIASPDDAIPIKKARKKAPTPTPEPEEGTAEE